MDEYQKKAAQFDLFEKVEDYKSPAFLEKVLGLTGEAGETADKIKKIIRDKDGAMSEEDKREVAKELGDVLWYLSMVADYIGISLKEVADMNYEKLSSRKKRNLLSGEGDNR